MADLIDIVLPADQTEGTTNVVGQWFKAVGDRVETNDPLLEIIDRQGDGGDRRAGRGRAVGRSWPPRANRSSRGRSWDGYRRERWRRTVRPTAPRRPGHRGQ